MILFDMGATSTSVTVVGKCITKSHYTLRFSILCIHIYHIACYYFTLSFFLIQEYKKVQVKEGSTAHIEPQLSIKGIGFDRTLGGLEMDMRLRNHLAKAFMVSPN